MPWKFNPFTGTLDLVLDEDEYVEIAGDTMTGPLVITPTSGDTALTANKDIVVKAGQKVIYDGA